MIIIRLLRTLCVRRELRGGWSDELVCPVFLPWEPGYEQID